KHMSSVLFCVKYSMFGHLRLFFFLYIPHPPISTLFPYTTLFRSFCIMEAIKLCRLDTPIIFIEARINLSRFVVTGCAAKSAQIGRASCRERVESWVVDGGVKETVYT